MASRLRSPVLLVIALELLVGAWIWFSNTPASAQPAAGSGSAAITAPATASPTASPTASAASPPTAKAECPSKPPSPSKPLSKDLIPIAILIAVIVLVVTRLPRVELGHTLEFRRRRLLNWLPLGLSYSFLYFGRYNIKNFQSIGGLTEAEYGTLFGIGSIVYGLSFLLNGPLTDRWGGRATILIATLGSGLANAVMGYMAMTGNTFGLSTVTAFSIVYGVNMYFQSFGAVSIVKVNAAWFHLRERGTFGGIFGILISLGIFFAYDVGKRLSLNLPIQYLFWVPAALLTLFFVLSYLFVRNQPSDTGHPDFDLGDATSNEKLPVTQVLRKLLTHPVILTISIIELCSGFLRQAIMQWGPDFAKGNHLSKTFVFDNWGMVLCVAGITGGMFAGAISDHLFQSRRSPVSAVLYAIMLAGGVALVPLFAAPQSIGWVVAVMSMAIIGVHGMLTATASADFAGKRNTGVAVGIIDGFVYIGSTIQSFLYGSLLPAATIKDADGCKIPNPEAAKIENWHVWPYAMIPVALVGFLLALRIWNAKPSKSGSSGH
ncbi:MAG TPA: MFS transporter [Kofleriaceae bacterium]|jgi:OPA family glycerol-3-phosphate transporter-like MFS transporter|nr:MFS transporter [Kofleriaceae bacterium]